jgi:hypothetical protein
MLSSAQVAGGDVVIACPDPRYASSFKSTVDPQLHCHDIHGVEKPNIGSAGEGSVAAEGAKCIRKPVVVDDTEKKQKGFD